MPSEHDLHIAPDDGVIPEDAESLPAVAEPSRPSDTRAAHERHPESGRVGPFTLSFSMKRPPLGAWQATCPFHALNDKTGCTKAMKVSAEHSSQMVRRMLLMWCLQAPHHTRKSTHSKVVPKNLQLLPEEVILQRIYDMAAPPAVVIPDDNLEDGPGASNPHAHMQRDASKTAPVAKTSNRDTPVANLGCGVLLLLPSPFQMLQQWHSFLQQIVCCSVC